MNIQHAIARNGTQQHERLAAELSAEFVSIEERSIEQQLAFMQQLTKHIHFINESGEVEGDWSGLLALEPEQILAYIDNPEIFSVDTELPIGRQREQLDRLSRLSQPQRVMVYLFLRMTQVMRYQFADLTQRHLDFYYQQVLQISPNEGQADHLHVVAELNATAQGATVVKGSLLDGGTDESGAAIQYALDDTYSINKAQITEVKSLRVAQEYQGLNTLRKQYKNGFEVAIRWALGQYFQGDLLAPYPRGRYYDEPINLDLLLEKYEQVLADEPDDKDLNIDLVYYVKVQLGFISLSAFIDCMSVYKQSIDEGLDYPSEDLWVTAMEHIEDAFDSRWKQNQTKQLVELYQPASLGELGRLKALLEFVAGSPNPSDPLPPLPTTSSTLESLYETLNDIELKATDDFSLSARYVTQFIGLTVDEYCFIHATHATSTNLYAQNVEEVLDGTQGEDWPRFFSILQRLDAQTRSKVAPSVGRWDVLNIVANDNVEFDEVGTAAFGEMSTSEDPNDYYGPGLAIVSPILAMAEGERNIKVAVACQQTGFPLDDLTLAQDSGLLHFNLSLSAGDDWFELSTQDEAVNVEVANIGQDIVSTFSTSSLYLQVQLAGRVNGENYVLMKDGSIWKIVLYDAGTSQASLVYLGRIQGLSAGQDIVMNNLSFKQQPTTLTGLSYAPSKQEISLVSEDNGFGAITESLEQGQFILLDSGLMVSVDRVSASGVTASVTPLGYLPEEMSKSLGVTETLAYRFTNLALSGDQRISNDLSIVALKSSDSNVFPFTAEHIDRIVTYPNGLVVQLRYLQDPDPEGDEEDIELGYRYALAVEQAWNAETVDNANVNKIYLLETYPGFLFDINLAGTDPAILPPTEPVPGFNATEPALKIQLRHISPEESGEDAVNMAYEYFRHIRLENVNLSVEVEGLESLILGNDDGELNANQPCEPFGLQPFVGSALYFTHHELARKKLSDITVNLDWVQLPDNLADYYKAYTDAYPTQVPALNNNQFNVGLALYNQRGWINLDDVPPLLFDTDPEGISHIHASQGFKHGAYTFLPDYTESKSSSPQEHNRYFKLDLKGPDFQHKIYPLVMRKQMLEASQQAGSELDIINEPYTPKVQKITVNYKAEETLTPNIWNDNEHSFLAHIHPFGGVNVDWTINPNREELGASMLPEFKDEGYLYLGLTDAQPLDEINIFTQVISGSGAAQLDTPHVHWFYRTELGWRSLPVENILDDTTQSMSFSGVTRVRLPEDATTEGPLMPEGKHWLAMQVPKNADAAAKVVKLVSQGMSATRITPMGSGQSSTIAAESVTGFVAGNADITNVTQFYPSYGGQSGADSQQYYRDSAERLRHRGRAVNIWDYERLALQYFPELRHTKCLAAGEQVTLANESVAPGQVNMMVIPDLSGQPLDSVLEPAVTSELLTRIEDKLAGLAPQGVKLTVNSPYHEARKYRMAVRFKPGYGPGIYRAKIVEALKRKLTPWSDHSSAALKLGNKQYFSELIDFLDRLEYVDYVAVFKGFEQETLYAGTDDESQVWREIDGLSTQVSRPDGLLVSSVDHVVDVISSEHFQAEKFQGVGYVVMELDNIVR